MILKLVLGYGRSLQPTSHGSAHLQHVDIDCLCISNKRGNYQMKLNNFIHLNFGAFFNRFFLY